jgi:hypothetical protein
VRYEAVLVTPDPGEVNLLRSMRESSIVRRPTGNAHEFAYYCDSRRNLEEFVDQYWRGRGGPVRARAEENDRVSAVRVLAEYWVAMATNAIQDEEEGQTPENVMEHLKDMVRDWSPEDAILDAAAKMLGVEP